MKLSAWHTPRPSKLQNSDELAILAYDNGGVLATDDVLLKHRVNGTYNAKILH